LFLGFDIGGSSIKYGWGNKLSGLSYFNKQVLENPHFEDIAKVVQTIINEADKSLGISDIDYICIGTPGTINKRTGRITGANPNLINWTNLDPRDVLPESMRIKAIAENDANLMALGESVFFPNSNYLLGITIGSGIGCGFVDNGKIYKGSQGFAMELGHNVVIHNGQLCNCGKKGCLEAYASVNGMRNRIIQKFSNLKLMDIDDILQATKESLEIQSIIDESLQLLSCAVANLIINLDADAVVFGGGVIDNASYPFPDLKEQILSSLPEIYRKKIIIKKARLGNKAGVWGAVLAAEAKFLHEKE